MICPNPGRKQSNDENAGQGLAKRIKAGTDNSKEMTTAVVQLEGQGKKRSAAKPVTNAFIREYRAQCQEMQ